MGNFNRLFQLDGPEWDAAYHAAQAQSAPFYLFDEERAADNVRLLRGCLGNVKIAYAMKANPWLAQSLAQSADLIEVCSEGELELCRSWGLPGDCLMLDGVLRSGSCLQKALMMGVTRFGIDSPQQMRQLLSASVRRPVSVLLRVTSGNQFGMDREGLKSCVQLGRASQSVKSIGIQYFPGTQQTDVRRLRRQFQQLRDWIAYAEELSDGRFSEIEFGFGLGVPYFESDEADGYAAMLEELSSFTEQLGCARRLTYEAGRLIAASCGIYVTEIFLEKRRGERRLLFCRGGTSHLRYHGGVLGIRTPKMRGMCARPSGACQESTVYGSLCSESDILAKNCHALDSGLAPGDRVLFFGAGAYAATESPNLFLGMEMPAVLLYNGQYDVDQRVRCIRGHLPTYQLIEDGVR